MYCICTYELDDMVRGIRTEQKNGTTTTTENEQNNQGMATKWTSEFQLTQ